MALRAWNRRAGLGRMRRCANEGVRRRPAAADPGLEAGRAHLAGGTGRGYSTPLDSSGRTEHPGVGSTTTMSWTRGGAAAVGVAAAIGLLAPATGSAQLEISPTFGFYLNHGSAASAPLCSPPDVAVAGERVC